MKRPELYHRTVDILVQAYFNDTLEHCQCRACAVGNIVAANMGMKLGYNEFFNCIVPEKFKVNTPTGDSGLWYQAIYSGGINKKALSDDVMCQVLCTGYAAQELAKIESAFEYCERGNSKEDYMFNGLMAVINCLDEIHENHDTEISQSSKSKFTRNSLTPIIH